MYYTPRGSKIILEGCIEWAVTLLIDYVHFRKERIPSEDFNDFLLRKSDYKISKRKASSLAYRLKKSGYVNLDNTDCVRLTNKAKIRSIEKIASGNKPDGKLRIVSFDIPEPKRSMRNGFRRFLKNMYFVQVQKSLWVCDRNVGDLVELAAKEFKVEDYVAYFIVEDCNVNDHIRKLLLERKKA